MLRWPVYRGRTSVRGGLPWAENILDEMEGERRDKSQTFMSFRKPTHLLRDPSSTCTLENPRHRSQRWKNHSLSLQLVLGTSLCAGVCLVFSVKFTKKEICAPNNIPCVWEDEYNSQLGTLINAASESCQKAPQSLLQLGDTYRKAQAGVGGDAGFAEELVLSEDSQNSAAVSLGTGLILPERTESKEWRKAR